MFEVKITHQVIIHENKVNIWQKMANRVLKDFPEYVLGQEDFEKEVDWNKVFGRCAPLHIEIGSGKGTFIVNQSKAFPEINFLGIEWANKYYRAAVDRIGRWAIPNARMLRTDAATWIQEHVGDETVSQYHIYFPDPWPKARHNKRRLICPANIEEFYRTLKKDGIINIATDHKDYFDWMLDAFSGFMDRFEEIEFIRGAGAKDGEMVGTNFERKYIVEGRKIYTLALRKK